jgi:hypothetical protein
MSQYNESPEPSGITHKEAVLRAVPWAFVAGVLATFIGTLNIPDSFRLAGPLLVLIAAAYLHRSWKVILWIVLILSVLVLTILFFALTANVHP